jgi:cobalt/nickel transport system permease protein
MTPSSRIIALSAFEGIGLLVAVLLVVLFIVKTLRHHKARPAAGGGEPDWSIPALDAQSDGTSLFHSWNPAFKIGTLGVCCFLIAALHSLLWSAVAVIVSIAAVALSGVPWQRPLRRLAAMSGFLLMLVVILPLSGRIRADEVVFIVAGLENWPFRSQGLFLALTIACKAASVALLMEPMLATASFTRTLQGFASLGLPRALIQMALLCHRYLFVFQAEIRSMQRSMRVRGFTPRTDLATMRTMGNCFGMLFIRSFERTERIYAAMLSRGYQGHLPTGDIPARTNRDVVKGLVGGMIGLILLLLDQTAPALW